METSVGLRFLAELRMILSLHETCFLEQPSLFTRPPPLDCPSPSHDIPGGMCPSAAEQSLSQRRVKPEYFI